MTRQNRLVGDWRSGGVRAGPETPFEAFVAEYTAFSAPLPVGETAPTKLGNLIANLENGAIRAIQAVAVRGE